MRYGYKASAEQFPPRRLLDLAIAAERAGFESVWTSDHFQPWRHTDGHAPNALVWLGAAAQATERVTLGTSVLTPSFRYNPAVVAQAFATLGCLAPGRVILGRRDRRVAERDPGRHRLAGAERAVRPAQGVGDAHPAAVSRGLRHVRGRVLPDPQRHDLRPAGRAGPDLHRGLRAGRRATRRADLRWVHLHLGQGPRALHRDAPARRRGGRRQGRARRQRSWPHDRDEGQLRHRSRAGDGGHQDLGRAGTLRRAEGRRRGPPRDGTAGRRPSRTSPTGAGWSRPTRTSTSSRSRRMSTTGSTTWSSTSRATTRKRRSPATKSSSSRGCASASAETAAVVLVGRVEICRADSDAGVDRLASGCSFMQWIDPHSAGSPHRHEPSL